MTNTDCECVQRLRDIAETRLEEARKLLERDLPRRFDSFTDAMKEGAIQLVARRLLRAGAYRATLDKGMGGQISPETALEAVSKAVTARPMLRQFLEVNNRALSQQMQIIDPQELLRVKVRDRRRLREALGGYLDRELDAAERLLKQLEQLERRLPTWKSYARAAQTPRLEVIADIHESER